MDAQFSQKRQLRGLLFGTIAGLAFAIAAWGVDGLQLANAHSAFPWLKFLPGLLLCVAAGSLVGWLTIRLEKVLLSLILWLGLACFYTWLLLWIPQKLAPLLLQSFMPTLGDLLFYPRIDQEYQFAIIGVIVTGFVCLLCGLMEVHLIDQSMMAEGVFSQISPILIAVVLFGLVGTSGDYLINRHFREPLQAMDSLIQFGVDNAGKDISPVVSRQKRFSVVRDLSDILDNPRSLTLIAYDAMLGQMDFLVDFDGKWVRCSVIYSQPTMCKRIKYDVLRYAEDSVIPANLYNHPMFLDKNLTNLSESSEQYHYRRRIFTGTL
jgi:hypothetical protein